MAENLEGEAFWESGANVGLTSHFRRAFIANVDKSDRIRYFGFGFADSRECSILSRAAEGIQGTQTHLISITVIIKHNSS